MTDTVETVRAAANEHPGRGLVRRLFINAGMFTGATVLVGISSPALCIPLAAVAGLYGWIAWNLRRSITPIVMVNRAYAAVMAGDRTLAVALLDDIERERPISQARRLIASHRASLAFAAGDPKEAERYATIAMDVPIDLLTRDVSRVIYKLAISQRALARAVLRDEGAMADARIALDPRDATADATANAEIAQAVCAMNRGDKDTARATLERARPFFNDLGERKREILRRIERSVRARKRSAYRHAAKDEDDESVAMLVATPQAAAAPLAAPAATRSAPPVKRVSTVGRRVGRTLIVSLVSFVVILAVLAVGARTHWVSLNSPHAFAASFLWLLALLSYSQMARSYWAAARERNRRRRLTFEAIGGSGEALAELQRSAKTSADAALAVARLHEARGDFESALAICERGIGLAASSFATRIGTYDLTHPGLYAERALCFAALGRVEEATSVMSAMPNPMYAHAPAARLRVQLAQALACGDRIGALAIARARGDAMPLPRRDAVLIDLLEATEGHGASDEEWSRLHAELAADPALAKWIDHFMPKSTMQRRVAEGEPLEEEDSLEGLREEGVDA